MRHFVRGEDATSGNSRFLAVHELPFHEKRLAASSPFLARGEDVLRGQYGPRSVWTEVGIEQEDDGYHVVQPRKK